MKNWSALYIRLATMVRGLVLIQSTQRAPSDSLPLIFSPALVYFVISQPFLSVFLPQQWLLDSHSSTKTISDQASVKKQMDQLKGQMRFSGPVSHLCWIFFPNLLRTQVSDTVQLLQINFLQADHFFCHLFVQFPPFFKDTLQTMPSFQLMTPFQCLNDFNMTKKKQTMSKKS